MRTLGGELRGRSLLLLVVPQTRRVTRRRRGDSRVPRSLLLRSPLPLPNALCEGTVDRGR